MPGGLTYPYLTRYVRGATVADRIQKIKRPLQWVRWAVFIGGMIFFSRGFGHIELALGMVVVVFVSLFFDYLDEALRQKTFKVMDLYRKGVGGQLPRVAKDQLAKGTFPIKDEAGAILEHCAQMTTEIQANFLDGYVHGGSGLPELKPTFAQLSKGSDVLFRAAFNTLYRPILYRVEPSPDEIEELKMYESHLQQLYDEGNQLRQLSKGKPALDPAVQETIERIKATIELRQGS